METVNEAGEHFDCMLFHSPYKGGRTDRTVDSSVSPTHLSSPSVDPSVYDSEYATSLAPSFSLSDSVGPGKGDGRQDAILPNVDSSQSTSEKIHNIALRKLQLHGYVERSGEGPTDEPGFKCLMCDTIFFGKQEVMDHVFIFHPEVEPYECQVCDSSFHSKNSLKLHYLLVHTTKRMVCDVCGKRFSDPSLLKSHKLFHEVESHVCDVCNKQFSYYWSCRKHKKSHQQNFKQKYKCGFCLLVFYSDRIYWEHVERHNSSQMLNCCRCNETFVECSYLAEHWNSHENEQPQFLCPGCDWLYYTKKERLKHWRTVRKLSETSVKKLFKTFKQSKQLSVWDEVLSV
ncbi:zinc finger protein 836-like [Zootermopsis nevadensis]|uniref:zinc finger protein 836-like n=1 Tax=Zootermopsis nevadensis TaxID=136037 RepID=UPI000B8E6E67|nr:zinc finger protein 836-like [Zootermopsis nevadensis]